MEEPFILVGLMAIALLAGFVDSIAGGGGLITIPSLLSAGIQPHLALGTNKMVSICGTAVSTFTYVKRGILKPKMWYSCALATLIGSGFGASLAMLLDASVIKKVIPIIIIMIALYMLLPKRPRMSGSQNIIPSRIKQIISGCGLGAYDGLIGPGTGSFWTLLSYGLFKQDLIQASAIARYMNFMSNLAALCMFFYFAQVNWKLGFLMGGANMIGGYIGTCSAIKYGEKLIRPLFTAFVVIIASRLAYIEYWMG